MAVVVDLKDMHTRTPEQVLRVFFRMYDPWAVELALRVIYGKLTVSLKQQAGLSDMDLENTAILFDQLIALVKAIDLLKDDPPGHCPVCGREDRPENAG
jgi:hypothetical protein